MKITKPLPPSPDEIRVNLSVRADTATDFDGWTTDQIRAFVEGAGKVIAAQSPPPEPAADLAEGQPD